MSVGKRIFPWRGCVSGTLAVLLLGNAATATPAATPALFSNSFGWVSFGPDFIAPPSGPRPIENDPTNAYDFHHVPDALHGGPGGEGDTWRVADLSNPILQPWARDSLKKVNQRILSGGTGYTPKVRCWPMGVPAFHLYNVVPMYFIQTQDKVWLIAREDHMVRRVYMNVPHSARVTPSWFGESVGHYEGDTLVVDTIGLKAKSFVDNFRTPHTEKLHVVERFRVAPDSKTMQVDIAIEDPGAFTTPWHAIQRYTPALRDSGETTCADNTELFGEADPIPVAEKIDF